MNKVWPMQRPKDVWLQIRVDRELRDALKAEAGRQSAELKMPIGASTLARQALVQFLEQKKKKKK